MSGRGRGESKKVHIIDEADERIEMDRQAQLEAARITGLPESEIPIRGRGGFRQIELRTIPENITQTRVMNLAGARQIDVLANFVPIISMPSQTVHMYRIDFEPQVESERTMSFLFRSSSQQLFTKKPIYDHAHECRSGERLPDAETSIVVDDNRGESQSYTVKYTHTGTIANNSEMKRIYNMQMKEFLRTMGFYSPQAGVYVHQAHYTQAGPDLMMLRGYRTSANLHDGDKMLMNLEAAHKIVQTRNVLQVMSEVKQRAQQQNLNMREIMREELIGKVVVASYNHRVYRIEDIEFEKRPHHTFDYQNNEVSFIDFYKNRHQKEIMDPNQPLLKVVPNNQRRRDEAQTREILLVPELCNIAGLTTQQRSDGRLRFELIRASQVAPRDRVKHMRDFLASFHENAEIRQQLTSWGYNYGKDAVRLQAHVKPMTAYATRNKDQPISSWSRANLNSADVNINDLAVTPTIKKIVVITTRGDLPNKQRILSTLKAGFDKIGLVVGTPLLIDVNEGDSARHYIEAIRSVPQDASIAIVVMRAQNKERYDAIKKAASVEKGLITQVVTAKLMTDEKKARSAAQKIGIQIAAKVGGEPWHVDIPLRKAMICGYDTYHDTAQRGRSFGAFVASMNDRFSRWWSKADAHDRLDEISTQMPANMTEAVNHYRQFNKGELPDRVILYRDGVGEGQLEHVFTVELNKIKAALTSIKPGIKFTMIIVNKRIGARFYMRTNDNSFDNPPPGTVIDHTVTRQERYDFYLVSQSTRQGSVTPTYYNIIHDESMLAPEIQQQLAFKLCLLYYNWSGTVRVPAPCQYAHKLALLCGEHLHGPTNANMDDKLHFL